MEPTNDNTQPEVEFELVTTELSTSDIVDYAEHCRENGLTVSDGIANTISNFLLRGDNHLTAIQ